MKFVQANCDDHGSAILEIFNDAILHSTALYDYKARTMETMRLWFQAKSAGNFPVIAAVDDAGELMGFASYGSFRAFPAYKYTVEHSVYVKADCRGQGVGLALLKEVLLSAQKQNYHVLVGAIDASNQTSIKLHERLGFKHSGTIRQAGFKFGRWLDLAFYQLVLETPTNPIDG